MFAFSCACMRTYEEKPPLFFNQKSLVIVSSSAFSSSLLRLPHSLNYHLATVFSPHKPSPVSTTPAHTMRSSSSSFLVGWLAGLARLFHFSLFFAIYFSALVITSSSPVAFLLSGWCFCCCAVIFLWITRLFFSRFYCPLLESHPRLEAPSGHRVGWSCRSLLKLLLQLALRFSFHLPVADGDSSHFFSIFFHGRFTL